MPEDKSLSPFVLFFYKLKLKLLPVVGNAKLVFLLTIPILIYFYLISERHIKKEFYIKSEEISKNIAFTIETVENEMREKLSVAALYLEKELTVSNLSKKKLIELTKKLNVSGIDLNDKNGFMSLTDRDVLDDDYKHSFYRELNMIDLKSCETQMCNGKLCRTQEYEVRNCKVSRTVWNDALKKPLSIQEVPTMFFFHHMQKVPIFWVVFYNPSLSQFVSVTYFDFHINRIIEKNMAINKNLVYIAIKDQEGNLVTQIGTPDKDNIKIEIPFGKEWRFNIEGKDVVYSYILHTEFNGKSLTKEVFGIRVLFAVISSLLILIVLLFREKLKEKDQGMEILKNALKRK